MTHAIFCVPNISLLIYLEYININLTFTNTPILMYLVKINTYKIHQNTLKEPYFDKNIGIYLS